MRKGQPAYNARISMRSKLLALIRFLLRESQSDSTAARRADCELATSWSLPEKPRGMWHRAYERHCAALARIEGNLHA